MNQRISPSGFPVRMRARWVVTLMAAAALAGGCATSVVQNDRLERFDATQGYRMQNLKPGEGNSDSLLVILTFSGGGTRAASLAFGTLEALRDTRVTWEGEERRLLDEVDIISSVSGGSLPAAYYGLFGERIFEDFPEDVLYKNIQGGLIKTFFSPRSAIMVASSLYTRTDILADGFDREIFERKTFGDLLAAGERPYIVINATDISRGHRFEFTQDQFDHLYSDLSTYKIGHAVASSASFPGAFPPMSIRNYERGDDYVLPDWVEQALAEEDLDSVDYRRARGVQDYSDPNRSFIHLADGGVADNLGLLPVIQMLRGLSKGSPIPQRIPRENIRKVLILSVNAEVKPLRTWDMRQSPLGLVATLVAAGSTPLSNFTTAEIAYMKLLIENQKLKVRVEELEGDTSPETPDIHFVEVSFNYLSDPAEREALNQFPTSFKLEPDQVDRLRAAAVEVLKTHSEFQAFLSELK